MRLAFALALIDFITRVGMESIPSFWVSISNRLYLNPFSSSAYRELWTTSSYYKRIDRANSELSKLIIGQTMTIEDGSSLSQSETHLEVFQNLVESDCDMLRDIVNNQLIPRMVRHGFPVKGLRFDWDYSIDYTPEQQKAYEEMVLQHYKVKPQYFEEKYGIPCEEKEPKEEPDPTEPKKKKDGKPAETLSRFFD